MSCWVGLVGGERLADELVAYPPRILRLRSRKALMIAPSASQAIPAAGGEEWVFPKESWALGVFRPAGPTKPDCAFAGGRRSHRAG